MKYGNKKVDQVTIDGLLVENYDTSLSPREISAVLTESFKGLKKAKSKLNYYVGEYQGHQYAIRCKNVTYLGNPHPKSKKRIQISDDLFKYFDETKANRIEPLLLGIYTYEDNTIFVSFSIETYVKKAAHNSSAHIYSSDIAMATEDGFFEKTDYFGNTVTAFRPDVTEAFLDDYFNKTPQYEIIKKDVIDRQEKESPSKRVTVRVKSKTTVFLSSISPELRRFYSSLPKKWNGMDCYTEMVNDNYRNKFQPEWAGFYLEYAFEKYLNENDLLDRITYAQDKSKGGIDLDLYFPQIDSYGDLKVHSEESRGIQGNDWNTVFSIINENKNNHIYYIVFEHSTEKDSVHSYVVTQFWNKLQKKDNLMSYSKKMKNNVTLKKAYILDINSSNVQYLSLFKQGINSNGKPRPPKIMIEHDNIDHFIIDEIQ